MPPDQNVFNRFAKDRNDYTEADDWWYVSGYADARSGYGNAKDGLGTVSYASAMKTNSEAAYDLGYEDGLGDAE